MIVCSIDTSLVHYLKAKKVNIPTHIWLVFVQQIRYETNQCSYFPKKKKTNQYIFHVYV